MQEVSSLEASWPPELVEPAGQGKHEFEETYSFTPQIVGVHSVFPPEALSPASFVVPAGQLSQVFDTTL